MFGNFQSESSFISFLVKMFYFCSGINFSILRKTLKFFFWVSFQKNFKSLRLGAGVSMSGTLVPISENLGTGHIRNCGYRVPARKKFWEPMGIGYQPENFFLGTAYRSNFQRCPPLTRSPSPNLPIYD